FAALLDTVPEAIQGRSVEDVFDGEGAVESQATDDTVIESGEPVTEEVTRVVDDTERVFITNKFPYYGLDGEIRGVMGISREITDRKARERTMQRQNRRLNRFASVVSHDLRNPLNLAQGRLQLAREECDSDHLDAVETAHERIDTLVTDLLTLARQGAIVDEDDVPAVDLAALAEEAWAETSTPTATLRLDTEARIEADPERLRQLLENLFRNAVEHAGDDVVVTLASTDDGFAVTDDGPGFSDEQERSLVGDDGDGDVSLGMSIVGEIAEAHGWDVTLSGGSNGGARIEVTGVTVC
ncbi:MAG: PAS domain-containing sensor histidine kinase, partial [Halobaculum sp.]